MFGGFRDTEQFARFNVFVTDVEPSGGNYVEAVIGGRPGNIGKSGGIAGIAPVDYNSCSPIEKAVAYVFSRNISSDRRVCEITAHEVGHTMSLEHEYKCEDPMTYLGGCGQKTFQDSEQRCGTSRGVRCKCRGGRQNTVQALYSLVGTASGEPPPDPRPWRCPMRLEAAVNVRSSPTPADIPQRLDDDALDPEFSRRLSQQTHMHQHGGSHEMWRLPIWVCQRRREELQRFVESRTHSHTRVEFARLYPDQQPCNRCSRCSHVHHGGAR